MRAVAIVIAAWTVSLAACAGEEPRVCHFPSGRPCVEGEICLGEQGLECGYVYCEPDTGSLAASAPGACFPGPTPEQPGGPFDCDPGNLDLDGYLPPSAPCPLGALWSIENGFYGRCVPVTQCLPLPCDPRYGGDGCPSDYVCDAASSTCVSAS
jgi:hypothetical protein